LRPAGHCPQPGPQSSKTAAGAPFRVTLWCSCGKWPADSRNPTRASPVLETSSSAESYKCMPSKVTATTALAPSTTAALFQSGVRSLRPAGHCPQPSPQSSKAAAGAPFWITLWCSCGTWPADSRNPTRASPVLETSSSAESYKCMPSKVTATTALAPSTTAAFVSEWGSQFAPCRPLPPAKPTEFQSGGRSPVLGNAVVQLRNMAGRLAEPHSCKPCAGNIKQCSEHDSGFRFRVGFAVCALQAIAPSQAHRVPKRRPEPRFG
jgi:hypothetical protein